MIKPPSKQLYQLLNPIEIIGRSSDKTRNEWGKQPQNRWFVLTLIDGCQNAFDFLKFWIPRFLAILLFIAPAMANETALPQSACQQQVVDLKDINTQLGAIAESFRSQLEQRKVQVVRITPVAGKPLRAACPVLTGRQKCKPGRRQSVKHNCKCGVW